MLAIGAVLTALLAGCRSAPFHRGNRRDRSLRLGPRRGCVCATWLLSRLAMTMAQGLDAVHHVRIVEALDLAVPERRVDAAHPSSPAPVAGAVAHAIATMAQDLHGADPSAVRVEPARDARGAATCRIHRGYLHDRHFFTSEQWRYPGRGAASPIDDLPYGELRGPTSYVIQLRAEPADLAAQWELAPSGPLDPLSGVCARLLLAAIAPVCEAVPGILIEDPRPRYQRDDRVKPSDPAAAAGPQRDSLLPNREQHARGQRTRTPMHAVLDLRPEPG
jgi:hypothetical protein